MWRVTNWDKHFETAQTRPYKLLRWVPMPNKHDGDGFTQLIEHEHGAMHYGAWCLLVQVASRCNPRGTLIRETGKPHDEKSLARMTRIGVHVFIEAIPRFIAIGWLEDVDADSVLIACRSVKQKSPGRTELNGTEQNRTSGRPVSGGIFEDWDSENWKAARRMRIEAANKLWPKRLWDRLPMKPEDECLLLKLAYVAVTKLSSDWWQTALDETVKGSPRKPLGLLKTCLWKRPRREGVNLNELLDSIEIPPKRPAESGNKTAAASAVNIGAMPE